MRRKFKTQAILEHLRDNVVGDWDVGDWIYEHAEFVCSDEYENVMSLVFPFEGTYWRIEYEENDNSSNL